MKTILVICALLLCAGMSNAQQPVEGIDARSNSAEFAQQLGSTDPLLRRRSAEALARLAATEHLTLVQGYQVQEKNKDVRLALDWALYRMGRSEALYRVVRELDSERQEQAIGYLAELEVPDLLYPFLKKQNNPPRVNAGLLKALARNGDAQTLEIVKPFRDSTQPFVAEAAEIAHDEIEKRLGEPQQPTRVRPRTVGTVADRP